MEQELINVTIELLIKVNFILIKNNGYGIIYYNNDNILEVEKYDNKINVYVHFIQNK